MKAWTKVLLLFVLLLWTSSAGAQGNREIVINIPAFTLYLYEDGVPLKSYPISVGTELNPSVLGETTIINKVENPTYYPPGGGTPIPPGPDNPVGTRWLGLGIPGYGIHGTNNPSSIGSAASLGCIRMLNHNVEELTNMVSIGTPVKLIYRTVLIGEDPLLRTKTITIYPDVYKLGVTPAQLQEELARRGWEQVFWPALELLLKTPAAQPQPLPWAVEVVFNGESTGLIGAEWNGRYYLPWDGPFDPRSDLAFEAVKWGEGYYLPLESYLQETGLRCSTAQGTLHLHSPTVQLGEESLGRGLIFENELYISGLELERQLLPGARQVVWLWGELYQPARALLNEEQVSQLMLVWPKEAAAPSFP